MVDVDHFKNLNDSMGMIWDKVLKQCLPLIEYFCNPGRAFRYGVRVYDYVFRGKQLAEVRKRLLSGSVKAWRCFGWSVWDLKKKQELDVKYGQLVSAFATLGESLIAVLIASRRSYCIIKKKGRNVYLSSFVHKIANCKEIDSSYFFLLILLPAICCL